MQEKRIQRNRVKKITHSEPASLATPTCITVSFVGSCPAISCNSFDPLSPLTAPFASFGGMGPVGASGPANPSEGSFLVVHNSFASPGSWGAVRETVISPDWQVHGIILAFLNISRFHFCYMLFRN